MFRYILRRLYWFFPVFLLVVVLLFILDQKTTKDQFLQEANASRLPAEPSANEDAILKELAASKGWDLPPFYFSMHHQGWSPDFYQEIDARERRRLHQIGQWTLNTHSASQVHNSIKNLNEYYRYNLADEIYKSEFINYVNGQNTFRLLHWANNLDADKIENKLLVNLIEQVNQAHADKSIWNALPVISWHGVTNRFHNFIKNYLFNGRQFSKVDGILVYQKIWPAVGITIFINVVSLILLTLICIPLGLFLFRRNEQFSGRILQAVLYILFALPLFWLATFVLLVAAGVPGIGVSGMPVLHAGETPSVLSFLRPYNIGYLVLPIVSVVLGLLAFLSIQMYRSLRETDQQKFILAARSRGISESNVLRRHNRPVAIYSIITILGNSIPALISGSVVIEIIFNIPGMGRLLWQSLYAYDWSVVTGILLISVVFSVIGQLLTDISYYYVNPTMRVNR